MSKVAFIGLGAMGTPMASCLAKSLQEQGAPALTVWNRTASKAKALVKSHGCTLAEELDSLIDCDYVIGSLANDEAATVIYHDLIEAVKQRQSKKRLVIIDTSTLYPTLVGELAETADALPGVFFCSCPVFGRPDAAAAAKLVAVISGDPSVRKDVANLMVPAMARMHIDVGSDVEKAARLKLCGNQLILGVIELLAEAFTLSEKAGVGGDLLFKVVEQMFPAPSVIGYAKKVNSLDFHGTTGFSLTNGLKDSGHIRTMAEKAECPVPIIDLAHQNMVSAKANGAGDQDWSSLTAGQRLSAGLHPFEKTKHLVRYSDH